MAAPHVVRAGRHDIDMGLQDQRTAFFLARMMHADDDRRLRMLFGPGRSARMIGDGRAIHRKTVHRVAAFTQRAEDEILAGVLGAAHALEAHEFLREGDLVGKARIDGGQNFFAQCGVEGHAFPPAATRCGSVFF